VDPDVGVGVIQRFRVVHCGGGYCDSLHHCLLLFVELLLLTAEDELLLPCREACCEACCEAAACGAACGASCACAVARAAVLDARSLLQREEGWACLPLSASAAAAAAAAAVVVRHYCCCCHCWRCRCWCYSPCACEAASNAVVGAAA
jgi:hypothetical protein